VSECMLCGMKELELRMALEQVAHVEQALREAEERHARELAEVTQTMHTYLKVWMMRDGWPAAAPLLITQDELREAAHPARGSRLAFEIEPDGETLRISEAPPELVGVAGPPPSIPGPLVGTKPNLFVPLSALRESEPLRSLEELVTDARANLRRAPGGPELNHVELSPKAYDAIIHDPRVLASPLYRLTPELFAEIGLGQMLGVPVFIGPERSAP
jgi:hypothetical protein